MEILDELSGACTDSILIVAHPDDEVLWFSSALERVNSVLVCFLKCITQPEITEGRSRSLASHPLDGKVSCLGLDESGTSNLAHWPSPATNDFGVEIRNRQAAARYEANYSALRKDVGRKLRGRANVFTHNPWGEYGHEEHVQVYRAVKSWQKELGFNLWVSNFCSYRSSGLMLRSISLLDSGFLQADIDTALTAAIRDLYKRNGCWTWYEDWDWAVSDVFIKCKPEAQDEPGGADAGRDPHLLLPLRFINMGIGRESLRKKFARRFHL